MKKSIKSIISLLLASAVLFTFSVAAFAETSFSYRFADKRQAVLDEYADYALLFDEEMSSTPIPGMEQTKMADGSYCYNMVPQGFCFAGEFMLISAYDYEKEFNSVIYVISNIGNERKLLTVIELPEKNHVGGIACDGENVYVARSSKGSLGVISLNKIRLAAITDSCKMDYDKTLDCGCDASFVTCYDGKIWVGVFVEKNYSELYGFTLSDDTLEQTDRMYLPRKTQGVVFFEEGSTTYLAASTSYGRNNDSKLVLFEITEQYGKLTKSYSKNYILPPLTQEIDIYGDYIYLSTESPATEYTSTDCQNTNFPVDRISAASISDFVSLEPENENIFIKYFYDTIYKIDTLICEFIKMF